MLHWLPIPRDTITDDILWREYIQVIKPGYAQHGVHADPAKTHAGQAGWILTAKMALFVDLSFVRFVSESRPASRRYPLQGATRTRAVGRPKIFRDDDD